MADTNNDDALDLLYLVAKTTAFPLSNKYLAPSAAIGQMVLAFNPLWAERFGRVFPDVVELQGYLWEHCWQPIDLWPAANQRLLEANDRVDGEGRVRLCARPDQLVVIVCGGLGGLHAVCLPSWADSELASRAAVHA